MDESQKHYIELKKSVFCFFFKEYLLYDFIYMEVQD